MENSRILFLYWKILGLCPFNITKDGIVRISYTGTIYGLILTVVLTFHYQKAIGNRMSFVLPHKTPMSIIANFSGLSIELTSLVAVWMSFGLRLKQLQRILFRLKDINDAFANHGIDTNDVRFIREVKIHVGILNIAWCLVCIISYQLFLEVEPNKLFVWMPLMIQRAVNHNVVLIFIDAIRFMKTRFRLLNKMIICHPNERAERINVVRNKNRGGKNQNAGLQSFAIPDPLDTYGQLHGNLVDLATSVVEFFSLSLLFTIIFQIIQMAGGCYTLCMIAMDAALSQWAFVWVYWVSIHVVELIVLVYICDSTINEANRAGSVLHTMLVTGKPGQFEKSGQVLSLRLLQKQLRVKVYGLFEIKHAIINRITGMVIVYVTIMMQLDSQSAASQ